MATRVDAANELDALKAQLADFALRHAADSIARDPKRFLSSDLMKAIEQSALAAVEARLAREPRPSAEDIAEQVLAHIRPELSAAIQGAAGEAPRAGRADRREPTDAPWDGLARELRRHWATLIVVFILIAAAGGAVGYVAGLGIGKAEALRPPAPTPMSESVPLAAAPSQTVDGTAPAGTTPPVATGSAAAAPAGAPASPAGSARPQR